MEAGGYATTRGVRYQGLWAVGQLLLVLAEEVRSVRIEPAGREGEGVDLIVLLCDGSKEYQQCKRANRALGKWTMGELAARGVLESIRGRLGDDRAAKFRLVSMDPAPDLRDLAESARASLDAESFLRDQITSSSDRFASFQRLCAALELDHGKPEDLESARDLLRRCEISIVGDDEGEVRGLRSRAHLLVNADSGAVVAILESAAFEKLRSEITAADVDGLLRARGLNPRRLERDDRIVPAMRRLQESFEQSLAGQLIAGRLLPRDETVALMNLLADPQGPRLIALHGAAGVGKSGVVLEATRRLSAAGVPYIPIRLDRQRPGGSLTNFGESLCLPESPGLCLGSLSAGGEGILLLDQLDALRWTHADAGQALAACRELVREAMSFPKVRVVACCRSFDLDHDPQIRTWLESPRADVVRVAARHAMSLYLAYGLMEKEARACINGPTPKRVGAAEVAADFAGSSEPSAGTARAILRELVNDEEYEVLERCGEAFHDGGLDRFCEAVDFVEAYASSRAFQRHPFALLHRLREHRGSLVPFAGCILSACRNLAASTSTGDLPPGPAFSESGYYLPGILLRLNEQAQEEQVRDLCLDAWDLLLEARVVEAVNLTKTSMAKE